MTRYLLDANIFIQAKNLHYGFDFCPAFWEWLDQQNALGRVASVERIGDELEAGEDELSDWANERASNFFLPPDNQILPVLGEVSNWVNNQGYEPAAIFTFLQDPDYWIICHARAYDYTIVKHEVASNSKRRVKIPDVCLGMNIHYVSAFQMLRRERARFVLGSIDPD